MKHPSKRCGCTEYAQLNRRSFLGIGAAAAAALVAPTWVPRVAYAQSENSARDVMVTLFLRGGCDGLSLLPPHGDPAYYDARPSLAIAPPGGGANSAIDLDGFFGLAPAMASLHGAYMAGDLLPVHACGSTDGTRSHFDAMHFMEVGKARDPKLVTGWLGRHLLNTAPMDANSVLRAVGISPGLQRSLVGGPQALPIPDPTDFRLAGNEASAAERLNTLVRMYENTDAPLAAAARATEETVALLEQLGLANYQPMNGAVYPESELGQAFRATAALIRGDVGVEAVAMDRGDWDTHEEQGPVDGDMAALMTDLSECLAAFHADVIAPNDRGVTVVVQSEFGRVVAENGSQGTDHGHGNAMLVMGAAVNGGRVLTNWPGLATEQRYEGQDLAITIDYRDILHEVVSQRLGNPDPGFVFPDFTPTPRGVFGN